MILDNHPHQVRVRINRTYRLNSLIGRNPHQSSGPASDKTCSSPAPAKGQRCTPRFPSARSSDGRSRSPGRACREEPIGPSNFPKAFFKATCSSISSAKTSSFFFSLASRKAIRCSRSSTCLSARGGGPKAEAPLSKKIFSQR
jgi:hypothetical protein